MANLLTITPYSDKFYDRAFQQLLNSLSKETPSNIEIQFKYAEIQHFISYYNEREFSNLSPAFKNKIEEMQIMQTNAYLIALKTLSKQNVIFLNPIGKHSYGLSAGFNERLNKKFYHIRDLLKKMSAYNKSAKFRQKEINSSPHNIYQQLGLNNHNYMLSVTADNQIRLDLYIKQNAPQHLHGRYSYSSQGGWVVTKKQPLAQQLDYILAEQFFRMAVNKQIETNVEDLRAIANLCRGSENGHDIRLKRTMRVLKGDTYQLSLSEIYKINDGKVCKEVGDMMLSGEDFDPYLKKMFINFYSCIENQRCNLKFQIELQFTKAMNATLKNLVLQGKILQVRSILSNAMEQLYAIFYADHTTKFKEMDWLDSMMPEGRGEGRLDNEYGSYMRERVYRLMSEKQK